MAEDSQKTPYALPKDALDQSKASPKDITVVTKGKVSLVSH